MISDRSDFRVQIRRLFVLLIRMSYRWVCGHPFLLGFVGFLYFLHRTCPLLFSSLVTASPVLICTFVLLGTILSFGEPNIPEIEKEPETVHEAAHFRTEVSRDATVVERGDKSFTVESFVRTEKDVPDDGNDDADRLGEIQLSEFEDDGRPFDYKPLVDETIDEIKRDTQVRFEEKAFILELEKKGESVKEKLIEKGGMQVSSSEQSRKHGGSIDEMMDNLNEDQMDVSPVSPWRPMRHEDDEDDDADRDDSLDSGSDGAESSSPDASMTDIIPMLDELHPLLHSEAPNRGIGDGEGSDAASEGPHRSSSDEEMESDADSESHGEEGDNENEEEEEDEEEEEEKKEHKDDESKSAIKWTEADQKNVMDLGSLELERNQRLENLIARRRARHNMRVMAERNLIDFDSVDTPINMPPISTTRQNPFDLPYDSYDDMRLPPIPGSAPSIMFARRNPFDIPYEPNEEKPDLKGDDFQEEFSSPQPRDPVFRRHESFSVGPSMLGGPRHDRLRPFFVLERLANEGSSFYPFERQLSEVSESKVSSVPDNESVCTVLEDDEKKVDEHDADRETEIAKVDIASDHDEEKSHLASDHDEEKSHSSEDSVFDEQADSRSLHYDVAEIILGSAETHHEQTNMMEEGTSDKRKLDQEDLSDSDSSLSEEEEKIPDISEDEATLISEQKIDLHEESGASSQPSSANLEIHGERGVEDDYHHEPSSANLEIHGERGVEDDYHHDESAIHALCDLVDGHHQEPVYDSSPSASRFPSFSSVSSDYKPDLPGDNEDRELAWSDKSVVEQSSLEPDEHQVPTYAGPVSVVFSRNITFHEYHDAPEDTAELSCLTSDTSSSPPETPEYTTPMVGEGSRTEFFQEDGYEELDHVVERLDQITDLHAISQSPPEVMTEEADEIKEIDEGLLSELDTIGDFNAKEIVTDSEPGPSSVGPDTANQLTEALPVLEVRSVEDIDSAIQQIHEGSEVEDVILPSTVQDQLAQEDGYEELDHVVERLDQLADLHAISQSPPEVITEEADEIKEIDEGLLSELDPIGDFNAKEVVTDSEPGPSSVGPDTANQLTEALPILEVRSFEDIDSATQQIHEGSEVEDVILPSTVQDQLAQESHGNSTESTSDLEVVEATLKEDLDNVMNQAVVESMDKQPKSPESDGGSIEIKAAETEPSESSVEERFLDETNVPLNNTSEKDEEEEIRPKEITASDVLPVETRSLEEIPKPSEPKEGVAMEVISERVVIPTEATESDNVTRSVEVGTEEAKAVNHKQH